MPTQSSDPESIWLRRLTRATLVVLLAALILGVWQWASMMRTQNRLLRQKIELTEARLRQANQKLETDKIILDTLRQQISPRSNNPSEHPSNP